jgi:hypothetical protein
MNTSSCLSSLLSVLFEIDSALELSALFGIDGALELSALFGIDSALELSVLFEIDSALELSVLFEIDSALELSALFGIDGALELSVLFEIDSALELPRDKLSRREEAALSSEFEGTPLRRTISFNSGFNFISSERRKRQPQTNGAFCTKQI